jgi:hypothetical protein
MDSRQGMTQKQASRFCLKSMQMPFYALFLGGYFRVLNA